MSNHLIHLLEHWHPQRDVQQWVLGTVYQTQGSAYRKSGSFMLFNDAGQKFGLLSGGCLESDLHRKALLALADNQAHIVRYDSTDKDDVTFQLGLGCGGIVDILLQPINVDNNYLDLQTVYQQLKKRKSVRYEQQIPNTADKSIYAQATVIEERQTILRASFPTQLIKKSVIEKPGMEKPGVEKQPQQFLITEIQPPPHMLVIGGGIDARPLIRIGNELGWELSLADSRVGNARREDFPAANRIIRNSLSALWQDTDYPSINAVVIMSHNNQFDAQALAALAENPPAALNYCALLGPPHRREHILNLAKLDGLDNKQLPFKLHGPAGLDIGAELPEGIALSILAQCHRVIFKYCI